MNLHSLITSSSPTVGQTARKRRFAAWLLLGWTMFWLTTVIAPCCDILIKKSQAGQEPMALQHVYQGPVGGDPRELPCSRFADAQPAPSGFAALSFDSNSRIAAAVPHASFLRAPVAVQPAMRYLADRPPTSFHLRTTRLLI